MGILIKDIIMAKMMVIMQTLMWSVWLSAICQRQVASGKVMSPVNINAPTLI